VKPGSDGDAAALAVDQFALTGVDAGTNLHAQVRHYLPGRRGWIKTKNRDYWRYPLESEPAATRR
jgi:hypothetical protein